MALDPIAAIRDILGSLRPAKTARLLTANGSTVPGGTCKAIQCAAAGTITGKDAFGADLTNFPVTAGLNMISLSALTSSTAGNVWGLYDKAP
jgi:hypothetical protein